MSDFLTNIDWTKTLAVSVGFATVVQAAVAVIMLRGLRHSAKAAAAADETLRATKESSERQLRAYLNVDTCEIIVLEKDRRVIIKTVFVNSGQTPASTIRIQVTGNIASEEEFDLWDPDPVEEWGSTSTLGAGLRSTFLSNIPWEDWARALNQISVGDLVIGVVGHATYGDIFGENRSLGFRRQLRPSLHPTHLSPSASGNFAD